MPPPLSLRRQQEEGLYSRLCNNWKKPLIIGIGLAVLALNARFFQWENRFLEINRIQQQPTTAESLLVTSLVQQAVQSKEEDEDPTIMGIFPPDLRPLDPLHNPRDKCLIAIRQRHEELLRHYVDKADHILYLDPSYHENVGDTMLTMGILKFLGKSRKTKVTQCHYAQTGNYVRYHCDEAIRKLSRDYKNQSLLAVWHAGGNWGDLYPHVHRQRINSIDKLLKVGFQVLAMPSSYHYSKHHLEWRENAKIRDHVVNNTLPLNNNNSTSRVVFTWREKWSYDKALKLYPFVTNLLVPDIAFQLGPYVMDAIKPTDYDFLAFLRQDRESMVQKSRDSLEIIVKEIGDLNYTVADWPARYAMFGSSDYLDVKTAIQLLSVGKVTVADRLHASILTLLGDRPLVYVDQMTGKLNKTLSTALSIAGCEGGANLRLSKAVDLTNAVAQVDEILSRQEEEESSLSDDVV